MEMGRFCWCIIILVWVQACMIPGFSGCLEEEENALFLLKASINYPINESFSPSSKLINKQRTTTDCCNWTGVQCSNITGRVTHITLYGLIDSWSIGSEYWYLNTSLLLPFQELKSLYLDGYIHNFRVSKEGFERLSALSKLEELNLDYNDFNESILPSLGKIASLKKLSLRWNKISGRVPINKGFTMSKLEELNLYGNDFTDMRFISKIPSLKKLYLGEAKLNEGINIQELGKLKNLQELYLDDSSIDKSFLNKVGVMISLNVLSMRTCGLNGSLPNQGWCELKNLQELDLGDNDFEGRLPSCLANMTTLQVLNLAFNNFNGSISHSAIPSLQSLEHASKMDWQHDQLG
ncbi:receptor-like protein 56 isoform X2 [Juglans regia]|uniref:Receptor-like protein 56 isoform X2 n=1 Tax=Juglans regia TaxID=51240 RepID=A0A6P9EQ39_JUGRE|nr:receptor-like protein 56 isoform X2 [Juglans regia]